MATTCVEINSRGRPDPGDSAGDDGETFQKRAVVDAGAAGYSSLQASCDGVYALYEQADPAPATPGEVAAEALIGDLAVLDPDRIVLVRIPLEDAQARTLL